MAAKKNTINPSVTVDNTVFLWKDGALNLLLIKRKNDPFKDTWCLPGGFVEDGEDLDKAAKRELKEETGLRGVHVEQFQAFGDPKRDPRGRVISIAYLGLVNDSKEKVKAGGDADGAEWHSLAKLPKLGFDHKNIAKVAARHLKERVIQQLDGETALADDFKNHDLREVLLYMYSIERK